MAGSCCLVAMLRFSSPCGGEVLSIRRCGPEGGRLAGGSVVKIDWARMDDSGGRTELSRVGKR
jgi:hypothetical protein